MTTIRWLGRLGLVGLLAGCAEGTGVGPVELSNGMYELATVAVQSSCPLQDAVTEGPEYVGKVHDVLAEVTDTSVRLAICDEFFDDCFATVGEISLLRNGDELFAANPHWEVPACTCWQSYTASRAVQGGITADDTARLTWTFSVPSPPADCVCTDWTACEATVEQRLSLRGPMP
jgi:hypothetical protein